MKLEEEEEISEEEEDEDKPSGWFNLSLFRPHW